MCARPLVGNEPFAILLADDLIDGGAQGCLSQMIEIHAYHGSSVIAVEEVPPDETDKYGIVSSKPVEARLSRIVDIVEKPKPADAPSTLAAVGRYILTPRIFDLIKTTERGAGGEIQLTDAIARLLHEQPVYAYRFRGKRYDCGSKLGYLEATVEYALKHPELSGDFAAYLKKFCGA